MQTQMNPSVLSIHLFLGVAASAALAKPSPLIDVSLACVLCYVIGALNHLYDCGISWLNFVDCWAVRFIALFFVAQTVLILQRMKQQQQYRDCRTPYAYGVLLFAALTLLTYAATCWFCLYHTAHPLTHILACSGIWCYIKAVQCDAEGAPVISSQGTMGKPGVTDTEDLTWDLTYDVHLDLTWT